MNKILYVFLCSMVPIIELRGAIPLGTGLGLPWFINLPLSVIGNFLPVPFILLFIRSLLSWMKKVRFLSSAACWLEKKAHKQSTKVLQRASLGLFIFVAIPLPGTGAWTGALIASLLDMRMKYALPSIFAGVMVAGLIVTGISYGVLGFLSFLL